MGRKYDFNSRYRFLCEDHHIPINTSGHSEWHISKERIKRHVSLFGKQENHFDNCKAEEQGSEEDEEEELSS